MYVRGPLVSAYSSRPSPYVMLMSSSPSRLTQLTAVQRITSIRWMLPLFVITPVLSGIVLTSWLTFRSGQDAVEESVDKIATEVAANIAKQVTSYLSKPMLVSAAVSAEINHGLLDINDVRGFGAESVAFNPD